jgi:nitric oxide reductase NorQ protein
MKEGASTRLLIYAAALIHDGMGVPEAVTATLVQSLTDDPDLIEALADLVRSKLG